MEMLLDSFKKWLDDKQNDLTQKGINQVDFTENILGDKKTIIVNHSNQLKFGQITISETNSLAVEIILSETSEMIFSCYCNSKTEFDITRILDTYFDYMSKN